MISERKFSLSITTKSKLLNFRLATQVSGENITNCSANEGKSLVKKNSINIVPGKIEIKCSTSMYFE